MAAAKGKSNGFAIGVSIAVVVVLVALGGVVFWLNSKATDAGPAPKSEILNADTGALTFGKGKDTVAVYLDFQCPACNAFETQYGDKLKKAADDGKITLEYHPIAILDRYSQGTQYSSRSGAAAFCVAETSPDKYLEFAQTLFKNQPQENTPGLTNDQLAEYAKEVGADKAASCITDEKYLKYPAAQAVKAKIQSTPTIEINGKRIDLQKDGLKELDALLG